MPITACSEKADAIFCRNVIIYFDRPTQERILQKLSNCLVPGGYMFVGHAETLHDMNLPLDAGRSRALQEDRCRDDLTNERCRRSTCSRASRAWSREPTILRTLLGSCVGIAFRVPRLGVGALCHPMLPRCPAKAGRDLEPFRRPPLCGLRHSRSGPAIRRAGRAPRRGRGEALRRRRCAVDRQAMRRGPRWAG